MKTDLHNQEITQSDTVSGILKSSRDTPRVTISAAIAMSRRRHGSRPIVKRTRRAIKWLDRSPRSAVVQEWP